MKPIYLDYNATTPLKPHIYEGMLPYLKDLYGNPSSIHWAGRKAREGLMVAKERVANCFKVSSEEVVFTGSGTEANNLAIKGAALYLKDKGNHLITTQVEHKSVLECFIFLEKQGFEVTRLGVDEQGQISLDELRAAIRPETILISVQAANSETGVIQPYQKVASIAREKNILTHIDAIQLAGRRPLHLTEFPYDMVSISAHKMYGPKGVGALLIRKGIKLEPLMHGGTQERKRRAGTENVAAIVGFGLACVDISKNEFEWTEKNRLLRNRLEEGIYDKIANVRINGEKSPRIPNTTNITFLDCEGEGVLLNLDLEGVAASMGSACSSGSLDPSHVLMAMGHSKKTALSALRFSLGAETTRDDINRVLEILPDIVLQMKSAQADK